MQSSRHSAAFASRLEKYASRGFAIGPRWRLSLLVVCRVCVRVALSCFARKKGLPGLDTSLLDPDLLSAFYIRMKKKRDLLLRVLPTSDRDAPGVSSFKIPSGSKTTEVTCRRQKGKRVEGAQRLVVLSFASHVREVDSPFVSRTPSSSNIAEAYNTEGALLLHCEEKRGE